MLRTVGEPARIRLTADRTALRTGGQDLAFVTVEAVDAQGNADPNAPHEVRFAIKGPGTIAGVGNGDLMSEEPYQGMSASCFMAKRWWWRGPRPLIARSR